MASIELRGVSRRFVAGGPAALDGVDLAIPDGERWAILGPSGSGKTTILRLVAGLDRPTSGSVWFDGRRMDEVPPHRRDVGMVFQNPTLYPHLDVAGNLEFGLRSRGVPRGERRRRVAEIAALLRLDGLLARSPDELSGGERQRAAIGRALAPRPAVLLLDEPFSSLDLPLRTTLRRDLVDLHDRLRPTLIHVTHDQSEALSLGRRVALIERGRIVQVGSPREIHDRPETPFVARFVGNPPMNLIPCEVGLGDDGSLEVILDPRHSIRSTVTIPPLGMTSGERRRVLMGFRPEHVAISPGVPSSSTSGGTWEAAATIRRLEDQGDALVIMLDLAGAVVLARLPGGADFREGEAVTVGVDPGRVVWFPA
ncbi:ABC transporter ATP-binding protein [Planctomyces sp. SH-PL62]|uniref:ABC transporter ATP-binding protein n=1 Tax=Planctomyces sp. SH-PL62 TaxID=1636152 RepID=UPI00078D5A27|nr:ABC transporter ATP-binding protein [Planctomyces sp. SH-PL62]AMV39549.1 sn-glycerol-3-phosphate import ATP-binding protein UgpC [Planctomyces sp. SH-PL62]